MDERLLNELPAWLTEAGLAGAHVFIDTLHPVHEGRLFRWGYPDESPMHEYGRTGFEGPDATGAVSLDAQATEVWRNSPFYGMLKTRASLPEA